MAALFAISDAMFRWLASLAQYSSGHGRPLYLAPVWWWYQVAAVFRLLIRAKKSRYEFFCQSREMLDLVVRDLFEPKAGADGEHRRRE